MANANKINPITQKQQEPLIIEPLEAKKDKIPTTPVTTEPVGTKIETTTPTLPEATPTPTQPVEQPNTQAPVTPKPTNL
jgi:hypothetical protein